MIRTAIFCRALPLLALAAVVGACDDPTDVEDHVDAEGFAIIEDEAEIYRYMQEEGLPSTLTLAEGTHPVEILLLDADGDTIPEVGDEEEHEHELRVTIGDNSILLWLPEDHTPGHQFIEFHGELEAREAGSTVMEVCVPHGDHCDFDADVPVTVVEGAGA